MRSFKVPSREEVSESNKVIFDNFKKNYGLVPNLLAVFAYNETALADYITFQSRKSTLSAKEKEAINLIVSQVNECSYCLRGHTVAARYAGFTDAEIIQIRKANITFDEKLNALVNFAKEVTQNRGKVNDSSLDRFLAAGYTKANLPDVIIAIAGKIISNYMYHVTQIPIDWPEVDEI